MLTGPRDPDLVQADLYRRLATDVARAGVTVLADLTGPALAGALRGGVAVLRISDEEAVDERFARSRRVADLFDGAARAPAKPAPPTSSSPAAPKGALALVGDDAAASERSALRRRRAARHRRQHVRRASGSASRSARAGSPACGWAWRPARSTRRATGWAAAITSEIEHLVARVTVQTLDAEDFLATHPTRSPRRACSRGESRRSGW